MEGKRVWIVITEANHAIVIHIRAEEMRVVEQLIDRLKIYSIEPIEVRYF